MSLYLCYIFFFFFKQKTAYEMRISDWSSDVCSSDLLQRARRLPGGGAAHRCRDARRDPATDRGMVRPGDDRGGWGAVRPRQSERADPQIGRASCRERVCQYV